MPANSSSEGSNVVAVVGAQWGDEGKGRVVDYLARDARLVIRYQGGDNAGHMVVNQHGTFHLHIMPSGIFSDATCVVGTGTVVNPETLLEEIEIITGAGVSVENLRVSERAHLIMPYHRQLDGLEESLRKGDAKIGTTKRGVGPAYTDKAARYNLRVGDLVRPDFLRLRLEGALPRVNRMLESLGQEPLEFDPLYERALGWGEKLAPYITDTLPLIREAVMGGDKVLLEGQLGVMRDLDWGIYPYVTSSNPLSGGISHGAGIPPRYIGNVVGVVKAYSTAVGAGPLPCELEDADGKMLRDVGKEYGTTTGRPRRCGWFDGVAIQYASWLDGFTGIAVTKLDVLDDFDELKICTAYRVDGVELKTMPLTPDLERAEPIYETWPGWNEPTTHVRSWKDLPQKARNYLHRISELAGAPIAYVSVGPERSQMVKM